MAALFEGYDFRLGDDTLSTFVGQVCFYGKKKKLFAYVDWHRHVASENGIIVTKKIVRKQTGDCIVPVRQIAERVFLVRMDLESDKYYCLCRNRSI